MTDDVGVESDLDQLLRRARKSDPSSRIDLRDPIAAHGEQAIEAITDWLSEPRLSGFAIRVLERIGREPGQRTAVVGVLTSVDRSELPTYLVSDLDWALAQLGVSPGTGRAVRRRSAESPGHPRATGLPGRVGIGYWAMRTSPWERPYIWAEAQQGRLRQGWGWAPEQDLEVISILARAGQELSEEQQMAWRSRRMLSSQPDGMRVGDLILVPNISAWGQLCVFRLTGSYQYEMDSPRQFEDRFGHVLRVELMAGPIDRHDAVVSEALRSSLRNLGRLWNMTAYGGDVDHVVGIGAAGKDRAPTAISLGSRRNLDGQADALLAAIGQDSTEIGDRPLTLHWPTVGAAFDHGVLVVGQAVYGWMNSWTAGATKEPEMRRRIVAEAKDPFPHLRDPMAWIDGHHARRSPFWTVARLVTDALAPGNQTWFSRLAWANLYPGAPNDIKGNPGGALKAAQTRPAAAFLDAAIAEIQPRLVLVVGGPYVWPFVEPLGLDGLNDANKPLYLTGRRAGIPWIVGMHPAGASRNGVGPARYAELILASAQSMDVSRESPGPLSSASVYGGGQ